MLSSHNPLFLVTEKTLKFTFTANHLRIQKVSVNRLLIQISFLTWLHLRKVRYINPDHNMSAT